MESYDLVTNIKECYIDIPGALYYSHIPNIVVSLLLGFFVYKNNRSSLSKSLLFISITFSLWIVSSLVTWLNHDSRLIMFVWTFFEILSILLFIGCIYFVYLYLYKKDIDYKSKLLLSILFFPVLIFSLTSFYIKDFNITSCEATENSYFMYYVYGLETFLSAWIFILMIRKYLKSSLEIKKQIRLLSIGIFMFLFAFSWTNIAGSFTLDWKITQYGLFGMPVFLGFLSYLIVKHQAFNIKAIAGQFLTVSVWIAVFSQLFIVQNTTNLITVLVMLALTTILGWILFTSIKEEVVSSNKLKDYSNKLLKINDKLRELDRAKSEFISIASHQLRTPLTSIKGFSSLILENTFGKIPPDQKDAVEKIFVNNEKLVLLVEDMLNVSRLESGRLQYDFEEADVLPLVVDVVKNMKLYAKNKKLYLKLQKPKGKLPQVLADKRKLSEIVSNLIDNAIKYTSKGGIEVFVEGFNRSQDIGSVKGMGTLDKDWVRISVKDTGIGMEKKNLTSIFEKFKKGPVEENSKDGNLVSGTGLGVYISRQMTQAMDGKLYAQSSGLGKGTTFILELPGITKNGNG